MKKHIKIFDDFWLPELTIAQTWQCSVCNSWEGTDIHHISSRGLGSSKYKDFLENLICLVVPAIFAAIPIKILTKKQE